MGIHAIINDVSLSTQELQDINRLLSNSAHNPPEMEDIWKALDDVWDELGCNNQRLNWDKIQLFYSHPVWLLNGIFAEQDQLSMQNRNAIADWIALQNQNNIHSVLDYGGGFGTLARLLAEKSQSLVIDVYEPHPSQLAVTKAESYSNIHFISSFNKKYDCLISTDVLEHVSDPLNSLAEMVDSVRINGYLIIANCFYPVIKCHLPKNFHFRFTFNLFTKLMGLQVIGACDGSHATLYKKTMDQPFEWRKIRILERMSITLFPLIEITRRLAIFLKII